MKPLLSVVLSVVVPGVETGVARLRMRPGWARADRALTDEMAFWARRPWCNLPARLRDAMAGDAEGVEGGRECLVVLELPGALAVDVCFLVEQELLIRAGSASQSPRSH